MLLVMGLGLASACSPALEPADQGSSAVQAEEHRIETLLLGDLAASIEAMFPKDLAAHVLGFPTDHRPSGVAVEREPAQRHTHDGRERSTRGG